MTAPRKKSNPRPISPSSARCTRGVVAKCGQRRHNGRTDKLRLLGLQRAQQRRSQGRVRVRLEPFVGDLAQPVVRVAQQAAHEIARCRGSLNDESTMNARYRTNSSRCFRTASTSAGTASAGGSRRIVRAAFIRVE